MWKHYASGKDSEGVAIKSAVRQLSISIGRNAEIGGISYIDYSKEWPYVNEAQWRKRLSF